MDPARFPHAPHALAHLRPPRDRGAAARDARQVCLAFDHRRSVADLRLLVLAQRPAPARRQAGSEDARVRQPQQLGGGWAAREKPSHGDTSDSFGGERAAHLRGGLFSARPRRRRLLGARARPAGGGGREPESGGWGGGVMTVRHALIQRKALRLDKRIDSYQRARQRRLFPHKAVATSRGSSLAAPSQGGACSRRPIRCPRVRASWS
jgi:hypothetical protein